jgi:hypothetical protein
MLVIVYISYIGHWVKIVGENTLKVSYISLIKELWIKSIIVHNKLKISSNILWLSQTQTKFLKFAWQHFD